MEFLNTVIIGTGSYTPKKIIKNEEFLNQDFFSEDHKIIQAPGEEIIEKFQAITGIEERRYADDNMNTSDLAGFAAEKALKDADIDPETLDYIILAHNFGDVHKGNFQSDLLPNMASRVKHFLQIKNPNCIAYDILFGCPGWIQAFLQAHSYINSGMAKRILVIGAETLSRVNDKYDRDSMIFADGAGAAVIEAQESNEKKGLLSFSVRTDTYKEAFYLYAGKSTNPYINQDIRYIKMFGRKIYEYSLINVPLAMKLSLDRSGYDIKDLKKIIIHQANEKMDDAMVHRFYKLYGMHKKMPKDIMPMSINKLGNSSVATIPTLYDDILKNIYPKHQINEGDLIMFASVGSGMNINSIVYKL
ncbi:MAG: ketoacyl-ACP synthase III [Bacteroidales bacterium]|nr:ketoacyl-ACP synthase III [Bacteroidales bacterium]